MTLRAAGGNYKNGTTTAGTPRWRCPNCNASQTGTMANTANI
ncbi:hypothetical protein CDHC04_1956 [Corynebacterium diphtheriae HC04]|nr:hypothetical protein CDHC04_1956 [Corynebacterium diphtheriae HC04]